jgi:hypothetical protein
MQIKKIIIIKNSDETALHVLCYRESLGGFKGDKSDNLE